MTTTDYREAVLNALREVRPEADLDALPAQADLREELDIDSFDFLNVVIAIGDATGIDVPEDDYGRLATLDDAVAYLEARAGARRD